MSSTPKAAKRQNPWWEGLPSDWRRAIEPDGGFATQAWAVRLEDFLARQAPSADTLYPPAGQRFRALEVTPFAKVGVVILGQDPYHGPGQAEGLAFSVPEGTPLPPSLRNIYKELAADLGLPVPRSGHLGAWAQQGVLLLNAVLSVAAGAAGSHAGQGWEILTDRILAALSEKRDHLVFVLWGAYAQKKAALIDKTRHLVLEAPHPSPLSAHRGFFGSRPFSKINAYRSAHEAPPIDWKI